MDIFKDIIRNNQAFLLNRILAYARLHDYVKYTPTLEKAWIVSITGLSDALLDALAEHKQIPELNVDRNFINSPISVFGVIEAKRHRQRGVSLEMFLGLMKYYRQSYIDLLMETNIDSGRQQLYVTWINRFFDHNEIAFCAEWADLSKDTMVGELRSSNRELTNEKNKYLTIFESIPSPVILLDAENRCQNMNYAAQHLLQESLLSPGHVYYSELPEQPGIDVILPWIIDEFMDFHHSEILESTVEKDFDSPALGKRSFIIHFHRMLDFSHKFEGTVIILTDLTDRKLIEEQLRHLSFHDSLTGLYNRAYLEQEIVRIANGRFNPVGFISCDVDGLKLVNDTLGHPAGDSLLVSVGQIIKSCFRDSDVVARIGGDEFAALMPNSSGEIVQRACRRIKDKVAEHNRSHPKMPVSISVGWSNGNPCLMADMYGMIKEADDRMYADKQGNRSSYAALFQERLQSCGMNLFKE